VTETRSASMAMKPISVAYLAAPPLALLVASPLAFGFTTRAGWPLAVPFWLGILAGPGYIAGWIAVRRHLGPSMRVERWIEGSLLLAAMASGAGAGLMLMLGPFAALPAMSAYCALSLLGAFERLGRDGLAQSGSVLQRNARIFGSVAVMVGAAVGILLISRLGR